MEKAVYYLNERWSADNCADNPQYASFETLGEARKKLAEVKKSLTEGFLAGELIEETQNSVKVMMTVNWVEHYITSDVISEK